MGYYSEVALKIKHRHRIARPDLFQLEDDGGVWEAISESPLHTTCYNSSIKWYGRYDLVQAVESYLESISDDDYGMIRMGENDDDIEYYGGYYNYDLYVERVLNY